MLFFTWALPSAALSAVSRRPKLQDNGMPLLSLTQNYSDKHFDILNVIFLAENLDCRIAKIENHIHSPIA